MECFLYIVVYLTTMEPNEFGNHFVIEFCFRYNGDALDDCLIHKGGVLTKWLSESSFDVKPTLIIFITNLISVTSIYPMHTFLLSTLCRLLLGMNAFICNCCGFGSFSSLNISLWYVWWICKNLSSINIICLWYLLPISKHLHYLLFP